MDEAAECGFDLSRWNVKLESWMAGCMKGEDRAHCADWPHIIVWDPGVGVATLGAEVFDRAMARSPKPWAWPVHKLEKRGEELEHAF